MKKNNGVVSKEDYDKLNTECQRVKSELASLRNKIDAMNIRSAELQQQNKELKEQVESVNKTLDDLKLIQKEKDALFATVIHDIKNPAGLIKSLVELLRSYDLTANEQKDILKDIVETTTRIVTLSQEVSRILALEGGRIILNYESVNINEIIQDVYRFNTVNAEKKSINLLIEFAEDPLEVSVDPQKISEVTDNLLSNAIKFTPKNGTVKLKTKRTNDSVVVEVADNGLGLSEEDIRNAFHQGAQLSAKPTAGETSSGLGLWIVKKLVEAHKGRVWVKSALGKGSTFFFSLPVAPHQKLNNHNSALDIFEE
jgi:signal transduction histidine kinase